MAFARLETSTVLAKLGNVSQQSCSLTVLTGNNPLISSATVLSLPTPARKRHYFKVRVMMGKISAVVSFTHSTSANVHICHPEFKRWREGHEGRIASQINECVCKIVSCMHNSLLVFDFQSSHREAMLVCTSAPPEIPLQSVRDRSFC